MTTGYRLPVPVSRGRTATEARDPIVYRLATTVVHVRGTVTTTTSELDSVNERVERSATIDLDVMADPNSRYEIHPPVGTGWQDRQLNLALLTDGRLSGVGAEVVDRSGERLKAVVSLGATAAGGLLALGASPLAAGAAAVAAAAFTAIATGGAIDEVPAGGGADTQPVPQTAALIVDPEVFGIRPEFRAEHPADHALLVAYRFALLRLTAELAQTAIEPDRSPTLRAEHVRHLSTVLKRTRAEASQVEARYEAWLRSKERTQLEAVDLWLQANQIPTGEALRSAIRNRTSASGRTWWRIAVTLRTMVSIDYLDQLHKRTTELSVPAGSIVYRPPRPATLTTWEIVENATTPSGLEAKVVRCDRILVTAPGTEQTITVTSDKNAGKIKAELSPSGALTALDVSATSASAQKAAALSEVPGVAEQALSSGKAIGGAFDPKQIQLQQLERDLKIAEAKAKLKGPADPDATLKQLQDQLAVAQLEARLAAAEYVTANPSQATIIVQSST